MGNMRLENGTLIVSVSSLGAELQSIVSKKSGKEYLWNGDERFWNERAPILFPIVGRLNDGKYRLDGKEYELPIHGFARHLEYGWNMDMTAAEGLFSLRCVIASDAETLKFYPYEFELSVIHTLTENTIKTAYEVYNADKKDMYFSIGGHPGIICPFNDGETFEDYYLEFEVPENADKMIFNPASMCYTGKSEPYLRNEKIIELSYEKFKDDAITLTGLKSDHVLLKSKHSGNFVKFDFTGFPILAFWTRGPGAGYVCLEPWFGYGATEGFDGDFKEKPGIIKLAPGNIFTCSYGITINE